MALESITEIDLVLNQPLLTPVHAKQYDTARKVKAHLFDSGVWWMVPEENVYAVVGYKKSDHVVGLYDETEDHETAIVVDENNRSIIYITLDRNLLTTSGNVSVEVQFYDAFTSRRLSTFTFTVYVAPAALTELDLASNPYFNVLAQEIDAVIEAKASMTGMTASATGLPAGSTPTIRIDGGPDENPPSPYELIFGIPKGDKGNTGPTATPSSTAYAYATSSDPRNIPSSGWTSTPSPVNGQYLWSRSIVTWSNSQQTTTYAVSYIGINGSGAVNSVNSKIGDVVLTANDINTSDNISIQTALDVQHILIDIPSFSTLPKTVSNASISADHIVTSYSFGTPSAQKDDWTVQTSAGQLEINGTIEESTTLRLILTKAST